jgi:hypothetical protein
MNFLCFTGRKSFPVGNVSRGMYMFITWGNFGTKLFFCLRWGHLKQVSMYLTNGECKFSGWSVSSKFMLIITSNFLSIFHVSVDRRIEYKTLFINDTVTELNITNITFASFFTNRYNNYVHCRGKSSL